MSCWRTLRNKGFLFSIASRFQRAVSKGELANVADVLAGQFIATDGQHSKEHLFHIRFSGQFALNYQRYMTIN